ncbi:MFS transporter [Streptomyces sp. NPDC060085]|uniref:MFS transporter n=1 Tax=Streptomyces sp. NPDC060085 TaxID=3347054 RepID=UPI00365AA067
MVLGGELVNIAGSGASYPFLLIYLVKVCHVTVASAAALMVVRAILAVVGAGASGPLIDRFTASRVSAVSLMVAGIASFGMVASTNPFWGILAATVCTIATIICSPALDALLAVIVPPARRQTAFAWRQTAINFGGAGGAALAAGALALWSPSEGLKAIYAFDGLSFFAFGALMMVLARSWRSMELTSPDGSRAAIESRGGYRDVFKDPPMPWLCAIAGVVAAAVFAQVEVGLPALIAHRDGNLKGLGWMMAANMVAILIFQLPVQRAMIGRRRSSMLALSLVFFASIWILILLGGIGVGIMVAVGSMLGLAETLFTPVISALVNDLAVDGIRGRYNGTRHTAWTVAWMTGAAATSALLAMNEGSGHLLLTGCVIALAGSLLLVVKLQQALPSQLVKVAIPTDE